MDYDLFRTLWHETLEAAGLTTYPPRPLEAIELDRLGHTYRITVRPRGMLRAGPFHVTATFSWKWDAALAARFATTEEDLLVEVMGEDGYDLVTEQPWLRVDVSLNATLPWESPIPMPDASAWRRWVAEVTTRLAPLLPVASADQEDEFAELCWCNEPTARLRCDAGDGRLYLTRVEVSAWQGIGLPRQWDNPERWRDPGPDAQLADFAFRVRRALHEWKDCLGYLYQEE